MRPDYQRGRRATAPCGPAYARASMSDTPLPPADRADLEARVRALDPWFHDLDLGPGLRTKSAACANEPVDHPRPTWALLRPHFPESFDGLDVLDVGCNAGFYSFEAKRLGARRVLGVDAQRREVAQARLAAGILGLDVSFERRSVYDLSIVEVGGWDVVLALGLLYHCRHPLLALERLAEVTRGALLLETEVAPDGWSAAPEACELGGRTGRPEASFFLDNGPDAKEAVFNWFLPTAGCLASLLRAVGFDRVRHVPTTESRALFVCDRLPADSAGEGARSHRARLVAAQASLAVPASSAIRLDLDVWNVGTATWPASEGHETEHGAVLLGAHLLDEKGDVLQWDFRRYRFPFPVALGPGERYRVPVELVAPADPGAYRLELDLVREFVGWFEDFGGEPLPVSLVVTPSLGGGLATSPVAPSRP